MRVRMCASVRVCVCVRAFVRAWVRACVSVCVFVYVCARAHRKCRPTGGT